MKYTTEAVRKNYVCLFDRQQGSGNNKNVTPMARLRRRVLKPMLASGDRDHAMSEAT